MTQSKRGIDAEGFMGDYNEVVHFVKTARFDYAAERFLAGYGYQITRKLLVATEKRLRKTWTQKSRIAESSGYTRDNIAEEVLADTREWLEELHESGKIKKVGDH
jgi:hypothetical protein